MKFVINLSPITKKNSQQILVNKSTGRPFVSPSPQYRKYEAKAKKELVLQAVRCGLNEPIDYPINVKMDFYMGARRRVDLTNLEEACLDTLVAAGIIADDNCNVAASYDGSHVHYDKENPRTEIVIEEGEAAWL